MQDFGDLGCSFVPPGLVQQGSPWKVPMYTGIEAPSMEPPGLGPCPMGASEALHPESAAIALEKVRLANEMMQLQNQRIAQENMLLRMRSQNIASQMAGAPQWTDPAQGNQWAMPAPTQSARSSLTHSARTSLTSGFSGYPATEQMNEMHLEQLFRKGRGKTTKLKACGDESDMADMGMGAQMSMKRMSSASYSTQATMGDMGARGSIMSSFSFDPDARRLSSMSYESQAEDATEADTMRALETTPPHLLTTVMVRNIPNNYTRDMMLQLLDTAGFEGEYDLVYLPIDFKNKVGLGYAFINLVDKDVAQRFHRFFSGFGRWNSESNKVCEVNWSDALQGLDAHIERYRNSPLMHESVVDECKPVLFKDGLRVPFPEPTKRIRAPRQWSRRH